MSELVSHSKRVEQQQLSRLGLNPFQASGAPAEAPEAELELLPTGNDYVAHASPSPGMQAALLLVLHTGEVLSFQYLHLDTPGRFHPSVAGAGNQLQFRYAGSELMEVTIAGRNLSQLFSYISSHRMRWVQELPKNKDFEPEEAAVVHTMTCVPVKPKG